MSTKRAMNKNALDAVGSDVPPRAQRGHQARPQFGTEIAIGGKPHRLAHREHVSSALSPRLVPQHMHHLQQTPLAQSASCRLGVQLLSSAPSLLQLCGVQYPSFAGRGRMCGHSSITQHFACTWTCQGSAFRTWCKDLYQRKSKRKLVMPWPTATVADVQSHVTADPWKG